MSPAAARQSAAWAFLVGATLLTFWTAGHSGTRAAAIAISMAIATAKVIVVLHRFMELGRAALALRIFFYIWTAGCAAMIAGIAWTAG